jgi:FtsP/CotA-like multicopper oxidase with cupredoxin domain
VNNGLVPGSSTGRGASRREFLRLAGGVAACAAGPGAWAQGAGAADHVIEIAPYRVEVSAKQSFETVAYNGQVPGPLLRLRESRPVTIEVRNRTNIAENVHWHGLFLPSEVDGAMEEGTPMIAPGGMARYTFTPEPAGFRWFHTHTFAGMNLKKGQYSGQHGLLMIEPAAGAGVGPGASTGFDQEAFVTLHDWGGEWAGGGDGSMNPVYEVSTINGRVMGHGVPLQVKEGQRVLMHILNSSPTEEHWIALAGHTFKVVALDGNDVPTPKPVTMLRLAPAERVCAVVEMNRPGVWVMGEVRKHIQAAGMAMVVEYAGQSGEPKWEQPETLDWSYLGFGGGVSAAADAKAIEVPLVFESKFRGHGGVERWTINGRSYPDVSSPALVKGQKYRLKMTNRSMDDHPVHLHRHRFEITRFEGQETHGIVKDTVIVNAGKQVEVEFIADHPGATLFHCHQQDHMDMGFMMLFRYA